MLASSLWQRPSFRGPLGDRGASPPPPQSTGLERRLRACFPQKQHGSLPPPMGGSLLPPEEAAQLPWKQCGSWRHTVAPTSSRGSSGQLTACDILRWLLVFYKTANSTPSGQLASYLCTSLSSPLLDCLFCADWDVFFYLPPTFCFCHCL